MRSKLQIKWREQNMKQTNWNFAVMMTANYIGIKLNPKNVNVYAGEQFKPEFLKMNLLHTVPVIDDKGFYLAESRAIQAYLVNKFAPDSPIYPKEPQSRALVDKMLYFDIGTLFKAEADYLFPVFENQPLDPAKNEPFKKALAVLEGFLSSSPYVAGDHVTIADFSILGSLIFGEAANYSFADYPRISEWMKKVKKEIPSYSTIEKSNATVTEYLKAPK